MTAASLTSFEKKALEVFAEHFGDGRFRGMRVTERDTSPLGFILQLHAPTTAAVTILRERISRFTIVVQHPLLPLDGIVTLSFNQAGMPVELEAVSFDGTNWPPDTDSSRFVFVPPIQSA